MLLKIECVSAYYGSSLQIRLWTCQSFSWHSDEQYGSKHLEHFSVPISLQ